MKTKLKPLLQLTLVNFLLSGGAAQQAQAQTKSVQEQQLMNDVGSFEATPTTIRTFNFSRIGLKGSPLLLPNWVPGEVVFRSGRKVALDQVNYDVFERQVTLKRTARDSVRYQGDQIKQLTLQPTGGGLPLVFKHVPDVISSEETLKTDLVRVAYEGTYTLVELPMRKFIRATASQAYGGGNDPTDEFRDESSFHLIRPDRTAARVKLSRKSLVAALQGKGAAFETYLKKNQLDAGVEADVVKALASLEPAK